MEFSKSQKQAIGHVNGPCLVLAVPGAGKTTILIERILNLIKNHGVLPSEILALTFTRASAMDMRERIKELDNSTNVLNIKTIHSLCYDILTYYYNKINQRFMMIEDRRLGSTRFNILNQIKQDILGDNLTIEEYRNYLTAISNQKILGNPDSSNADFNSIKNFDEIFKRYEEYKKKNNLYDFDDLLIVTDNILKTNSQIKNYYKNKFKYISLDEAQDTSKIQWSILNSLLTEKKNLFAVADDDQSIYRFRGATPEKLMRFSEEFPGAKIIYLETNYRSRSEIVKSANRLIKHNNIRYKKNILANKDKSSTVKVKIMNSRENQYKDIIKNVKNIGGEIAIIYRNNLSAIGMMNALDNEMISFELKDHNIDFFNQSIYKDIVDILTFFNNPTDLLTYEKVYYKLKGYLTKNEAYNLKYKNGITYFEKIYNDKSIPQYKKQNIIELETGRKELIKNFKKHGLFILLNKCGYLDYLNHFKRLNNRGLDGYMRQIRTMSVIQKTVDDIPSFLRRLEELKEIALRKNRSEIKLMSMHSSKGLEFDTVFLIDLINTEIPGEHISKKELEEERRLLYVGMTRAKENLYMYSYKNDGNTEIDISRFLYELKK